MNGKEGEEVFFLSLFRFSLSFFKKTRLFNYFMFLLLPFFSRNVSFGATPAVCGALFFVLCCLFKKTKCREREQREREKNRERIFIFFLSFFSHLLNLLFWKNQS